MEYPRFRADSEFAAQSEFRYWYVTGHNNYFNPHCHEYFEIFLTVSGTVIHWINGETKPLPEGSLVFIRPDDIHGYIYETPDSMDTIFVNLSFRRELLHDLFQYLSHAFPSETLLQSKAPPTVLINDSKKKRFLSQLEELNTISWKDQNAMNLRMRIILADILTQGFSDIPDTPHLDEPSWLTHLILEMQQPEHFTAGSERMVALSRRTQEHLSRCMKKYYGMTVTEYINDLRINYASNLLLNTNTPVIEIGYSCGFQSLSNFYKAFGKVHGQSPTSFRRTYK